MQTRICFRKTVLNFDKFFLMLVFYFALGRDCHLKVMGFLAYDMDSVQNKSHPLQDTIIGILCG
jgi:hypothetical protein